MRISSSFLILLLFQAFFVLGLAEANQAPTAVGTIPSQTLTVGGSDVTVQLSGYFTDPDGDTLTYSATSFNSAVVSVSVSGSVATLSAVGAGTTAISVTATDPGGLTSTSAQGISVTVSGTNRAPTAVGTIPSQTLSVGGSDVTIQLSGYFSDPDGDTLTYSATSFNSAVVSVSVSGSVATLSAVAAGTTAVSVTATDPGGLTSTSSQGIVVTVNASQNRAPKAVGTIPSQTLTVGGSDVTVQLSGYFSDPDGDVLLYGATSSNSAVVSVSVSASMATLSAVATGTATITTTVTDPGGLATTQTISVTVSGGTNRAPTAVGTIPAQTVPVGGGDATFELTGYFSDPDGDSLLYSGTSSNSAIATVAVSATIATISPVAMGTVTIAITATDPGGLTATQSVAVTVSAGSNTPPSAVGTIPALTMNAGDSATVNVSHYFWDPDGDSLTYSATSSNTAVATISVSASTATIQRVALGTATITVTATDPGALTATQTFAVTVVNRAPTAVGSIGVPPLNVGSGLVSVTIGADSYFNDPDGDTLTYTASSSDTGVATVKWYGTSLSIDAAGGGTATVTVTATDPGGLTATQSVTVTVSGGSNTAPLAVGTISAQTLSVGGSDATVQLSGYFSDPDGDTLTYSATSSNSAVATVAVSASMATITPVAAGTATITVTATDPGNLSATQTFSVSVKLKAAPNRAPVAVGTIPSQTVPVGGGDATFELTGYFSDPDGDSLLYSGTSANSAIATLAVSASIATITPVAMGTVTITVTATDLGGLTATQNVSVTVSAGSNTPPSAVGTIPALTMNAGDSATVVASHYFWDPDGDTLTYSAASSNDAVATVSVSASKATIRRVTLGTATITVTATDPGALTATQTFAVTVVNRAPTAVGTIKVPPMSISGGLGGISEDVVSYFSDPDGDALTYTASSSDTGVATVKWYGTSLSIDAAGGGTATVTVTATDPGGLTATQSVTVTVSGGANTAPSAVGTIPSQTLTVGGSDTTVQLSGYFSDPDGDILLYSATSSNSAIATVAVSASMVTITPVTVGTATITVTATDPGNLSATQTFSVSVTLKAAPNRAPVAVGTIPSQTVPVGGGDATFELTGYFSDPDGDLLLYSATSSNSAVATVAVSASMATITPVAAGTATITVTATDPGNLSATQTFSVSVTLKAAPNRAPVAVGTIPSQTLSVGGSDVTVQLSGYFSDPDGDILTYSATSSNSAVAMVAVSASMATITPVAAGTATITVTATDTGNLSATQTFSVSVTLKTAPNRAPVAVGTIPAQTLSLDDSDVSDVTVHFDGYFSDPDGDLLLYSATSSNSAVASVMVSASMATITPVGAGTVTIAATATDPGNLSATQTFSVSVTLKTAPNRAPVAVGTIPAQTLSLDDSDVSDVTVHFDGYFSDPDGDLLLYSATSSNSAVASVMVSASMATITPVGAGTATITVTTTDPGNLTATQTISVTVSASSNRAPVPVGKFPTLQLDDKTAYATIDVSPYFSDPDGDILTYGATSSNKSVVTVSMLSSIATVTPVTVGNATITITASDGELTAARSVSVTVVAGSNRPPVAVGKIPARTISIGGNTVTVDISGYFNDPDGDTLTYAVASSYTRVATVRVSSATGDAIHITPAAEAGTTTITVTASDAGGLTAIQNFAVTANHQLNRSPLIVNFIPMQIVRVGGNAVTVDLSGYFSDPDGDELSYKASSSPSGVVTVSVSGATLTITPSTAGTATINVTANDGSVNASLPFSVRVNQPNRAPVAKGSIPTITVKVGGSATVYVGNSFSDPDGDTLTYTAASSNADIAAVSVAGSTVLIAPVAGGTATITVTATDAGGLTAPQTISVTVNGGANRAPVAVGTIPAQTLSHGGNAATVDLSGYFSDPDGDKLTYTAVPSDTSKVTAGVSDATLTIAISTVTAAGQTTVTVTASDPGGLTGAQNISVTVNPVADLNNDGIVNILDLVLAASEIGRTGASKADINGDGVVNILDISLVAQAIGGASAAPSAGVLTAPHVQAWLNDASRLIQTSGSGRELSHSYDQGILNLEQILASLLPESTALLANYPNPFNPETWMPYRLSKPSDVTLTVYSLTGETVWTFALGYQLAGAYQSRDRAVYWDGANEFGEPVASGIYFYTLTAGDFSGTRKMLIRK